VCTLRHFDFGENIIAPVWAIPGICIRLAPAIDVLNEKYWKYWKDLATNFDNSGGGCYQASLLL
jgi:hypothetical protein